MAQADGQRPVLQLLPAALKDAVSRVSPLAQLVQNILHRLAAEQLWAVAGHNLKQRQIGCLHDLLFYPRNLLHRDALFRVQLDGDLPLFSFGGDMMDGRTHQLLRRISRNLQ